MNMLNSVYKSLTNKKVLITGATGYIGSNLLLCLSELNCEIVCVNSPRKTKKILKSPKIQNFTYEGSIQSIEHIFKQGRFFAIFHLAGYQALDLNNDTINITLNSNILFGCHLLELSRKYDAEHFIYTESFFQFDEKGDYLPRNIYAASKQAFSDILLSYSINGLKSTSLVLFDVYGPSDKRNKLFNRLDNASKTKEELMLTPGEQIHYATFISDVISAICDAAILNKKNTFDRYWVYGEGFTLKKTIEIWSKIKAKKLNISWGGIDYFPNQILNPYVGKKLPNWSAKIKLDEGLSII